MKKVIDGKVYNTETAEEVHNWSNHYYRNDFGYCEETLYKTKKGNYFLYGEGGAMSKYSRPVGNNGQTGGDGITVMTKYEAVKWLENHDGDNVLIGLFSEEIEEA